MRKKSGFRTALCPSFPISYNHFLFLIYLVCNIEPTIYSENSSRSDLTKTTNNVACITLCFPCCLVIETVHTGKSRVSE